MTYQSVTGTLSPGGHPGSYNGQDAYNDLLVTQNEDVLGWDANSRHTVNTERRGGQRMPDKGNFNCVIDEPAIKENQMTEKGGDAMKSVVRRLTPLE